MPIIQNFPAESLTFSGDRGTFKPEQSKVGNRSFCAKAFPNFAVFCSSFSVRFMELKKRHACRFLPYFLSVYVDI